MNDQTNIKCTDPVPDLKEDYDVLTASSPMDCTGAVPSPPRNSDELNSYLDVSHFLPQGAFAQPNNVEIDMIAAETKPVQKQTEK
ncbi:MAG: hypothetical protein RSD28_05030 [Lachnospiraceae bacterium]